MNEKNLAPKEFKNPYINLVYKVWFYGYDMRFSLFACYLAFIVAQIIHSIGPFAFGKSIDLLQQFNNQLLDDVLVWQGISVGAVLLFWAFHGPARIFERKISLKLTQNLKIMLYDGLTNMPLKWHLDHHSGDTISREKKATIAIKNFSNDQFIYVETIIKFVVSIAFLTWIAPLIGLLSFLSCLIAMGVVLFYDKTLIPLYSKQNEIDNRASGMLFDYLSNITTIKTLRLGLVTKNKLQDELNKMWPVYDKEVVLNEMKWFWMNTILTVVQSIILITYIAWELYYHSKIPIGTVVMIFRYQTELSDVFGNLSYHYSDLVKMNSDLSGLNTITNDIIEHQDKIYRFSIKTKKNPEIDQNWKKIAVENLTFSHLGHDSNENTKIFDNFSFIFNRGEKIALIGQSGAGKSTLLKILATALQPQEGHLIVDENKKFKSLHPLSELITLIPQSPEIFENTIEYNLTLGLEVSSEDINKFIKIACFDSVLEQLPDGLNTDMREKGLNLSVGQSQRLALARGLIAARNSSIILLDEPTSSIDQETEEKIIEQILLTFPDKTIIATVHRLHLVEKFGRVVKI